MNLFLNIQEALKAIRANLGRATITILIIAFGLTALIGVLTSIDGVKYWLSSSFIRIGANTFRLENYSSALRRDNNGNRRKIHDVISYDQATDFKDSFTGMGTVSVSAMGTFMATAKYKSKRTQNNLQLFGGDESFIFTDSYTIERGRNFNRNDVDMLRNVIMIGHGVVELLFEREDPIGKMIQVDGEMYSVVGTFEKVGSQGMLGGDKIMVIPPTTLSKDFPSSNRSYSIHVQVEDIEEMDNIIFEAVGEFRRVRGQKPLDENNFGVIKVDAIIDNVMDNLKYLTYSATIISVITLISAAIGLMNIMLVSVTERTREIGVRKAMGATRSILLGQFLTEAIVITQLGGLLGVIFGVLIGNLIGVLLGSAFYVPWNWIAFGFLLCLIVGVVAGLYPARKAAKLDPIESLRYE